jgi:phosphatidylserine/phosphatidylglycerophosphate/cardiolipin synthase-like enzyme
VVSVDDDWLDAANAADLEAVAQALLDGKLTPPFTASAVQLAGIEDAATLLEALSGTDPTVIAWMLRRVAQERRRSDDRYANVARLVWSGASVGDQGLRDTRIVLDGLFGRAEHHVLISTFVIYQGRSVFGTLTERLRRRPGIRVDLYVHLPPEIDPGDERADVARYLDIFRREHWPEDLPLPAIYYDPEAQRLGAQRTTLHAKCVVVDERWALVTSANFTEAAQERNIEAGVLLDHPKIAEALAGRFRALREAGRLKPMVAVAANLA